MWENWLYKPSVAYAHPRRVLLPVPQTPINLGGLVPRVRPPTRTPPPTTGTMEMEPAEPATAATEGHLHAPRTPTDPEEPQNYAPAMATTRAEALTIRSSPY